MAGRWTEDERRAWEASTRLETLQSIYDDDVHRAIIATRKAIARVAANENKPEQGIAA